MFIKYNFKMYLNCFTLNKIFILKEKFKKKTQLQRRNTSFVFCSCCKLYIIYNVYNSIRYE